MRSLIAALFFGLAVAGGAGAQVTRGSIVGTVTNRGDLMSGVSVAATNIDTAVVRTTVTDTNGRFEFDSVPAGNYKIAASLEGFATKTVRARVVPGQSAPLNIDLSGPEPNATPTTGTVEGTVKSKKGETAISGASLDFVPVGGGDPAKATGNEQGKYVRDYLAPGTYDVTCTALGHTASTKRVTVVKDKTTQLNFELVK
jgi:hypothetical protein